MIPWVFDKLDKAVLKKYDIRCASPLFSLAHRSVLVTQAKYRVKGFAALQLYFTSKHTNTHTLNAHARNFSLTVTHFKCELLRRWVFVLECGRLRQVVSGTADTYLNSVTNYHSTSPMIQPFCSRKWNTLTPEQPNTGTHVACKQEDRVAQVRLFVFATVCMCEFSQNFWLNNVSRLKLWPSS